MWLVVESLLTIVKDMISVDINRMVLPVKREDFLEINRFGWICWVQLGTKFVQEYACINRVNTFFFLFKSESKYPKLRKANNFHNLKLKILHAVGYNLIVDGRVERTKENYPHNNHDSRGRVMEQEALFRISLVNFCQNFKF